MDDPYSQLLFDISFRPLKGEGVLALSFGNLISG